MTNMSAPSFKIDRFKRYLRRGLIDQAEVFAANWLEEMKSSGATPANDTEWRSLFLLAFDEFCRDRPEERMSRVDDTMLSAQLYRLLRFLAEKGSDPFRELSNRRGSDPATERAEDLVSDALVHPLLVCSRPAMELRRALRERRGLFQAAAGGIPALLRAVALCDFTNESLDDLLNSSDPALAPNGEQIALAYWLLKDLSDSIERNGADAVEFVEPDNKQRILEWVRQLPRTIAGRRDPASVQANGEIEFLRVARGVLSLTRDDGSSIGAWREGEGWGDWSKLLRARSADLLELLRIAVGTRELDHAGRSPALRERLARLLREQGSMHGLARFDLPDTAKRRLRLALRVVLCKALAGGAAGEVRVAMDGAIAKVADESPRDAVTLRAVFELLCYQGGIAAAFKTQLRQIRGWEAQDRSRTLSMLANVELDTFGSVRAGGDGSSDAEGDQPIELLKEAGAAVSTLRLQKAKDQISDESGPRLEAIEAWIRESGLGGERDRLAEILDEDDADEFEAHLFGTFVKEFDEDKLGQLSMLLPMHSGEGKTPWEDAEACQRRLKEWVEASRGSDEPLSPVPEGDAQSERDWLQKHLARNGRPRGTFNSPWLHNVISVFLMPADRRHLARRRKVFREVLADTEQRSWLRSDVVLKETDDLGRNLAFVLARTGFGAALVEIRAILGVEASGASLFRLTHDGVSALMAAARAARNQDDQALEMLRVVAESCPVDHRSNHGLRAIHLAYREGNTEAAEFLISRGAQPGVMPEDSTSIVLEAIRSGRPNVVQHAISRLGANPEQLRRASRMKIEKFIELASEQGQIRAVSASAIRLAVAERTGQVLGDVVDLLKESAAELVDADVIDRMIRRGDLKGLDVLLGTPELEASVGERLRNFDSPPLLDRVIDSIDVRGAAGGSVTTVDGIFSLFVSRCRADEPGKAAVDSIRGRRNLLTRLVGLWNDPAHSKVAEPILDRLLDRRRLASRPGVADYVRLMLSQRDDEFQDYPIGLANLKQRNRCAMKLAAALDVPAETSENAAAELLYRVISGGSGMLPRALRSGPAIRFHRKDGSVSADSVGIGEEVDVLRVMQLVWDGPEGDHSKIDDQRAIVWGVEESDRTDARSIRRIRDWLNSEGMSAFFDEKGVTLRSFCNWLWWTERNPVF